MRIRYVLVQTLWLVSAALAQPTKLMLPSPVQVAGMVVDGSGNSIPDVRIDNIDMTVAHAASDSSGRFRFRAKGPAVIFRKAGWKSVLIPVKGASAAIRVVMTPMSSISLATCSQKLRCVRGPGVFCLPNIRDVRTGNLQHDDDYAYRLYTVGHLFGQAGNMTHGAGLSYGGPEAPAYLIWKSAEFSEVRHDVKSLMVLDSRGRTADGLFWRSIGTSGEIVAYGPLDQEDAMTFDRILDGLCVLIPDR
jgi:hypothetical protein